MSEPLFVLEDLRPSDPADPKGMRELLFAGLVATLEGDLEDAWPDYDRVEDVKNPDGTSRQGTPYWQAWHHAAGIRSVLHRARTALQTHEEYLAADRQRSHLTWSEAEMACARHRDACAGCAETRQALHRHGREQARVEQVRDVYLGGITGLIHAIAVAADNGQQITVAQIDRELHRILDAGKRASQRAKTGTETT